MPKLYDKVSKKIGLPPGTLVHISERKTIKSEISLIDYDETCFNESPVKDVKDCFPFRDTPSVTWININGLEDINVIEQIDTHFGIHPLVQEDILHTNQRPKVEDYGSYLFLVLKMLYYDEKQHGLSWEQVSLLVGHNCVMSFQERPGDVFDPIRERLRMKKGRIRKMGPDYLGYALLDAIVDNYFIILEKYGDKIEALEDKLMEDLDQNIAQEIHLIKKDMIFLRKQVWPIREVISKLQRSESELIKDDTIVYIRDIYDHTIQVIDSMDSLHEVLSGLHDVYLSSMSNKMNEIMKVLTIFAAIFIPLTFLAGIYGMNFEYMPELRWRWGYYIILVCMLALGTGMILYFKKKKWI